MSDLTYLTHFLKAVQRPWHLRERNRYPLHPSVIATLKAHAPEDYHALLLEWPHVSVKDPTRLSYTASEEKALKDLQAPAMNISRYLTRHWPHLKSHQVQTFADQYSPDRFKILDNLPEMILAVERGPWSCMQTSYGCMSEFDQEELEAWEKDRTQPEPDWETHFYSAYAPEHGWALAVRIKESQIVGRALVNDKTFVRTYLKVQKDKNEPDNVLAAWLEQQGYEHVQRWAEGTKLNKLSHPTKRGYIFPYIDGNADKVSECSQHLEISDYGEYLCDQTDGTAKEEEEEAEIVGVCEDCRGAIPDDGTEYFYAGRDEGRLTCCTHYYTLATGNSRRGGFEEYYVPDDDAHLCVNGTVIDTENPPDGYVQLEDGGWEELDDVVRIADEYYLDTDDRVVELNEECPDTGDTHALKEGAWKSGHDLWHSVHMEQVELDGELYTEKDAQAFLNEKQGLLDLTAVENSTEKTVDEVRFA